MSHTITQLFYCSLSGSAFTVKFNSALPETTDYHVTDIQPIRAASQGPAASGGDAMDNITIPNERINWRFFKCPYCSSTSFVRCNRCRYNVCRGSDKKPYGIFPMTWYCKPDCDNFCKVSDIGVIKKLDFSEHKAVPLLQQQEYKKSYFESLKHFGNLAKHNQPSPPALRKTGNKLPAIRKTDIIKRP